MVSYSYVLQYTPLPEHVRTGCQVVYRCFFFCVILTSSRPEILFSFFSLSPPPPPPLPPPAPPPGLPRPPRFPPFPPPLMQGFDDAFGSEGGGEGVGPLFPPPLMQGFDDAFGSEGGGEGVGALVVPQGIHSLLRMATLGVRASGVGASGVGASGVGASIAFPSSALFTTPPFGFGNPTVPTSDALWYECNSGASAAGSVVSSSSIDEDEARTQRRTSSERTKARRRMSQAAANAIRASSRSREPLRETRSRHTGLPLCASTLETRSWVCLFSQSSRSRRSRHRCRLWN